MSKQPKRQQPRRNDNRVQTMQPRTYQNQDEMTNEWATGVCGCCEDCKICCCAFFCTPCFVCKLFKKSEECCCTPFCCPGALISLRTKLRTNYKIKGAIWKDYCAIGLCGWFQMVRMANELKYQGIDFF